MMRVWRPSVSYIRPKSRTERPRKTKNGTEVAHVARDSDTTFKVKGQLAGGGSILWRPRAQLVSKVMLTSQHTYKCFERVFDADDHCCLLMFFLSFICHWVAVWQFHAAASTDDKYAVTAVFAFCLSVVCRGTTAKSAVCSSISLLSRSC